MTINNTTKTKFFEQTKNALQKLQGSPIRDSKVRQFLKNQFLLENEHMIDSLFNKSEKLSPKQFLDCAEEVMSEIAFIYCYRDNNDEKLTCEFNVLLPAKLSNEFVTQDVEFILTFDSGALHDDDRTPIYFHAGLRQNDDVVMTENFYLENIERKSVPIPDNITKDDFELAIPALEKILSVIKKNKTLQKLNY